MLIMMFVHNPLKEYEYTKQIYIYNVSCSSSIFFFLSLEGLVQVVVVVVQNTYVKFCRIKEREREKKAINFVFLLLCLTVLFCGNSFYMIKAEMREH